jgi:hypothetical protein
LLISIFHPTPLLFSVFILFRKRWPQDEAPQKIPAQTYGRPRVTRVSQRFRMFRAKLLEQHQQANPPKGSPMTCGAGQAGPAPERLLSGEVNVPRSCSVAPAGEVPVPPPGSRSKVMTCAARGQNATRTWSSYKLAPRSSKGWQEHSCRYRGRDVSGSWKWYAMGIV